MLLLIQAVTGSDDLLPYSSAFEAVLYFYAASALITYMLADHVITRDELWAVGATFTLLAWAFAYAYTVVQEIYPGSYTAAVDPEAQRSWMELLFLSFTTLTSTGLSDVIPVQSVRPQPLHDPAARGPGLCRRARLPRDRAHRPTSKREIGGSWSEAWSSNSALMCTASRSGRPCNSSAGLTRMWSRTWPLPWKT